MSDKRPTTQFYGGVLVGLALSMVGEWLWRVISLWAGWSM